MNTPAKGVFLCFISVVYRHLVVPRFGRIEERLHTFSRAFLSGRNVTFITRMKKEETIHIGRLIKEKMLERRLSVSEFAARLHYERTNIYKIFKRESIDVNLLVRISEILQYNFLEEIYLPRVNLTPRYLLTIELDRDDLQQDEIQRLLQRENKPCVNIIHKEGK